MQRGISRAWFGKRFPVKAVTTGMDIQNNYRKHGKQKGRCRRHEDKQCKQSHLGLGERCNVPHDVANRSIRRRKRRNVEHLFLGRAGLPRSSRRSLPTRQKARKQAQAHRTARLPRSPKQLATPPTHQPARKHRHLQPQPKKPKQLKAKQQPPLLRPAKRATKQQLQK